MGDWPMALQSAEQVLEVDKNYVRAILGPLLQNFFPLLSSPSITYINILICDFKPLMSLHLHGYTIKTNQCKLSRYIPNCCNTI